MKITAPIVATILALGSAAAHAFENVPCMPEAPSGLKVVPGVAACTVDLTWNVVPRSGGCNRVVTYVFSATENGGSTRTYTQGDMTLIQSFPIKKNVAMTFQVYAVRDKFVGPKGAPVVFTCDGTPPAVSKGKCTPEAPTGFTIDHNGTDCGVMLRWNPAAPKAGCSGEIKYAMTRTENGQSKVLSVLGNATDAPTTKGVTVAFQVSTRLSGLTGPPTAPLSFTCDRYREPTHWSPNPGNPLHMPCVSGAAPCGRYLDFCQDVRRDKDFLYANCRSAANQPRTALTQKLPCYGRVDYDPAAGRLICVGL